MGLDTDCASSSRTTRLPPTFAALRHRNFRLWFLGQTVSLMGTWMQMVAQGWLVYDLTGSELALGTITFVGSLPTLFLMVPCGALADRVSRRGMLMAAQTVMTLQAFVLALLAARGQLTVLVIGVMSLLLGVANSFDAPARMALVVEMVDDPKDLTNAVALNSSMFNMARVVGPAVGGLILATLGPAWCFALNGFSFLAVLVGLWMMRLPQRPHNGSAEPFITQIKVGLSYIAHNQLIVTMIAMISVSMLFGLGYATLLPAFAADILRTDEAGLGGLNAAGGIGALVGSLLVASLGRFRGKGDLLIAATLIFPLFIGVFALSRSFPLSCLLLAAIGFGFVIQTSLLTTSLQSLVPDALRGRVMAVYALAFFGTTPFAALFAGATAQAWGLPLSLLIGGAICLVLGLWMVLRVPALRHINA